MEDELEPCGFSEHDCAIGGTRGADYAMILAHPTMRTSVAKKDAHSSAVEHISIPVEETGDPKDRAILAHRRTADLSGLMRTSASAPFKPRVRNNVLLQC